MSFKTVLSVVGVGQSDGDLELAIELCREAVPGGFAAVQGSIAAPFALMRGPHETFSHQGAVRW